MSRRSTVEKVLVATVVATSAASPLEILQGNIDGRVYAPKAVYVAAAGSSASVTFLHGGVTFLTLAISANDTVSVHFPDGLECNVEDDIEVSTDEDVDVSFYYCQYDESAGVTKVQSRANTYNNVTATRAPNETVGQSKS